MAHSDEGPPRRKTLTSQGHDGRARVNLTSELTSLQAGAGNLLRKEHMFPGG